MFTFVCVLVCVCVWMWVLGSVRVLALVQPYLSNMKRAAILSFTGFLAAPCFSTFCHSRHNFRKEVTEHTRFLLISSAIVFEILLILRRIQRDIVTKCENVFM